MTKHFLSFEPNHDIGKPTARWNNLYVNGSINVEKIFIDSKEFPEPIVWVVPGKVKYGDEAFVCTAYVSAEEEWEDLCVNIPLMGKNPSGGDAPYNWIVDWGDGIIENVSGISSWWGDTITHDYLVAGTYIIVIKPVIDEFQWFRACANVDMNAVSTQITSIDYITNKSMMESATSYGDYYMYFLCFAYDLIYPINEVKTVDENQITTIGRLFKSNQYYGTDLLIPEIEWLPPGITTIGDFFRDHQYTWCWQLQYAAEEYMPNSVISIGTVFRQSQYSSCECITSGVPEVLSNNLLTIGDSFRQYIYSATKLTAPVSEYLPNSLTTVGNSFRSYQYCWCSDLLQTTAEYLPNNVVNVGTDFRRNQYCYCPKILIKNHIHVRMDEFLNSNANNYYDMFYLSSAKSDSDAMPNYKDKNGIVSSITTLTPGARKRYCYNRTGISGYASLNAYWK